MAFEKGMCCRDTMVITTAQTHSIMLNLKFSADSNPTRDVS